MPSRFSFLVSKGIDFLNQSELSRSHASTVITFIDFHVLPNNLAPIAKGEMEITQVI